MKKGGEKMNSEAVISRIDGLNSLSTFQRWRKFAEKLCNVNFQQRTIQVGKTTYTKIYEFSESDVEKFRQVADLRNRGRPIKEAVIEVFENQEKKNEKEVENKEIIDKLIISINAMDRRIDEQTAKIRNMNQSLLSVGHENYQLKHRINDLENGKLDKPFSRKKS